MNNGTFLSGRVPLFFLARIIEFFFVAIVATLQDYLIISWLQVTRRESRCHSLPPPQFEGGTSSVRRRHLPVCSTPWNILFHPMEHFVPCHGTFDPLYPDLIFQALEQVIPGIGVLKGSVLSWWKFWMFRLITLKGDSLTLDTLSDVCSKLAESSLPYFCDVSLYDHLTSPALIDHIDRRGKTIYKLNWCNTFCLILSLQNCDFSCHNPFFNIEILGGFGNNSYFCTV